MASRLSASACAVPACAIAMASATEFSGTIFACFSVRSAARMVVEPATPATVTSDRSTSASRPDARGGGDEIGALDDEIGRAEIDALPALLIDRGEADIDPSGCRGLGQFGRRRRDEELDLDAEQRASALARSRPTPSTAPEGSSVTNTGVFAGA